MSFKCVQALIVYLRRLRELLSIYERDYRRNEEDISLLLSMRACEVFLITIIYTKCFS